jgi:ABC-type uncharacterized transport system auxiliary subunit
MKKIYAAVLFPLFLWGCMSSPARRYYQLHLTGPDEPFSNAIDKTILVETVSTEDLYDDYRVVYRLSPFELNYYSYEFWADKPAKLVQDSVANYLTRKNVFKKVIQEISRGEPDLVWKSKVHSFEEIDTKDVWYARLAMEVELVDFKSKERLYSYRFDRKEELATKNVALVPVILSKVLREELEKIVLDIAGKME